MATYRKKPIEVEATQWWRNGDHPADGDSQFEGQVVRYYPTPRIDGRRKCQHCGDVMHKHGWIDTFEGGYIVCPGDWVITGVRGERYPCKPDVFEKTYERVARSGEAG